MSMHIAAFPLAESFMPPWQSQPCFIANNCFYRLHCGADQPSNDATDHCRAECAPIFRVEGVVVVVAMSGLGVVSRLMMTCDLVTGRGRRLRRAARFIMPLLRVTRGSRGDFVRRGFCGWLCRLRTLYCRRFASHRLAALGCRIGSAGERDCSNSCDCESFDDLVHCFFSFVSFAHHCAYTWLGSRAQVF